jgi:mevalonate kinase
MLSNEFPSKILFFGEYGILLNSQALLIPYPLFKAQLRFSEDNASEQKTMHEHSNQILAKFCQYIKQIDDKFNFLDRFDHARFEPEISEGLYFDSNIPAGYGLGSSGTLTAAVYSRYLKPNNLLVPLVTGMASMMFIKNDLALLESFFHGQSSGIDPLLSYYKKPLIFSSRRIEPVTFRKIRENDLFIFLIDTKTARNTGDFVKQFLLDSKDKRYLKKIKYEYLQLNEICINTLVQGEIKEFFQSLHQLSEFQFQYFRKMIPDRIKTLWESGLGSVHYKLKLCGSGGGGYMLAFATNKEAFQIAVNRFKLTFLEINLW